MNELLRLQEFCNGIGCTCIAGELMSAHTSFKIGGPADLFIRPRDGDAAALVIREIKNLHLPMVIIGKGSDLLVSDDGIRGVVLALDEQTSSPELLSETMIRCSAGTSIAELCAFALDHSLTGLEFAWGIPGSVGGAVYMNAGAYYGEMKDVVASAEYLDSEGNTGTLQAAQLTFSYRHSWFTDHHDCLITSAVFCLQKGDRKAIRARMEELMAARKSKQPLEYPSAGSTFKRPAGSYASALIDQCGLKGRRVGGAMVSEKHAGFVINYENATCRDVLDLIEVVKHEVSEKTGFMLECEIKLLGF
ncbi:UDP-N-acetylmuramate dehydrogenase [Oscillospiraceae bacterium PP1C4]